MGLNQGQTDAVRHHQGPCMVLAGPGSGKTLTIAKRIEHLINHCGVNPEYILVITFTKLASKEMRERFLKIAGGKINGVTFGTFHGIYYGILKWAYKMDGDNILSEEEKQILLRQIVKEVDAELEQDKDFYKELAGEIGSIKNNRHNIEEYQACCCDDTAFRSIFLRYETERKRHRKIDFDDMLVLCCDLFEKRSDILAMWQKKFQYILVDEFQDINKVQYDVLKMLAAPEHNLFVVGDDDQSIYRFRGACPEIMLGFGKDYEGAKQITLDKNYRCSQNIVNAALRVIRHNKTRFDKEVTTDNKKGTTVHIQEVLHPIEESKYVVNKITEILKAGVLPDEIAVLFRTNTEARALVETLMEYNIAFDMKERLPNIYEHFINKDLMAYMRLGQGGRERQDFLMVMNRPNRYISRDSVEGQQISFERLKSFHTGREWMQDRMEQLELDLRCMKSLTPYAAIQFIKKRIGYDDFLKEYAVFRKISLEDLQEILNEIEERAKEYKTVEDWFVHIKEYGNELMKKNLSKQNSNKGISLLTMHGAKGLEYKYVFIIGANETLTPHKKAQLPEEIEEERRMFYVAMTRAKEQLVISYTKERNGKELTPSRFVNEILHV